MEFQELIELVTIPSRLCNIVGSIGIKKSNQGDDESRWGLDSEELCGRRNEALIVGILNELR